MLEDASPEIQALVRSLRAKGAEVWLIGSRANPHPEPPNDWDFLAFGSAQLLKELSEEPAVAGVDLMIVHDGERFRSPWPRPDGLVKWGELASWQWQRLNQSTAQYRGTKGPNRKCKAVLINDNAA